MKFTLEQIERIAEDITSDNSWVNDSHTKAEHNGICDGMTRLIKAMRENGLINFKIKLMYNTRS